MTVYKESCDHKLNVNENLRIGNDEVGTGNALEVTGTITATCYPGNKMFLT